MSNDKSRDALSDAPIPQRNNSAEVVTSGSPLDIVLWAIALVLLVGAVSKTECWGFESLLACHVMTSLMLT